MQATCHMKTRDFMALWNTSHVHLEVAWQSCREKKLVRSIDKGLSSVRQYPTSWNIFKKETPTMYPNPQKDGRH